MKHSKRLLLLIFLFSSPVFSQILKPVKWNFSADKLDEKNYVLVFDAKIDRGWHVYSQFLPSSDGPIPTSFHFETGKEFKLAGKVEEGKAISQFDASFEMILNFFEEAASFKQKVEILSVEPFSIKGYLEFMVCDNEKCLPPEEVPFEFRVSADKIVFIPPGQEIPPPVSDKTDSSMQQDGVIPAETAGETVQSSGSLWAIFITGILGGLLALITPCVFPMIPLTVSFFLNRSRNRARGILEAFFYSFSIIVIYILVGFLVSKIFGSDALSEMTSNVYFNIAFFLLFALFGISFLGAFELQLPASWANKTDAASERGGFLGIFFMALTLVFVSFSCTGPIIGALLVEAATGGNNAGPLAGMTGFAIALGLPFGLFAAFPGWMKTLPKSGGWLNGVKVTLGIIILAFSLKFLSGADLAYHWGILTREVFLSIWITLFIILGLYFLGKIKFSHDSDLPYVSVPRLFFAITSFAFSAYMIPGLWGAPLKAISAFTPPLSTQSFNLTGSSSSVSAGTVNKKYGDLFHCPLGINCFFDYEEGMKFARTSGKPALVDFTGWGCVNCKKMEATVWSDPRVLERLHDDFVVISLYIDDKTGLPEDEKYISPVTGKKIKTIGNRWSDFQISRYKTNSQPYYVLMDAEENILIPPRGYTPDIELFISFLEDGKKKFRNK